MNKLEIIQEINTLKRNKRKYPNLERYNYKLNSLYKKLSNANAKTIAQPVQIIQQNEINLTDDEKITKIIYDFMINGSYLDIINNSNIKLLSKKIPLFDLFLIENNLLVKEPNMKYEIQTIPIINNDDKNTCVNLLNFLLKLNSKINNKSIKILIILIIYDLIFRNFKLALDHYKFILVIKDKLNEFQYEINEFNNMLSKYNIKTDIITKWNNTIDEYLNNN